MKLRIMLFVVLGVAGAAASYAFAGDGHGKGPESGGCDHMHLAGTLGAPQSFTVTVTRAGKDANLTSGQVVTVVLGSTGQTVRFRGEGCVGTDGTLTVREAELDAHMPRVDHGQGTTTAGSTSTSTSTSDTTTSSSTVTTQTTRHSD